MKRFFRTAPVLTLILIMLAGTISVGAYNYEISLSAGNGSFEDGAIQKGDAGSITVTSNSTTFELCGNSYTLTKMPDGKDPDSSIYFVRGIKLAGEDNDQVYAAGTIDPEGETAAKYRKKDLEFVVAYGLKSSMVQYTASYVGTDGETLLPAETFYGIAGDTVILTAKYVDGYQPRGFTGQAVLSSDESENDFTFLYDPIDTNGNVITIVDGGGAGGGAGGAGGGAGGAVGAGAGDGGANIGDGNVPRANEPAGTVDLNDNNTPLEEKQPEDIEDNDTPLANIPLPVLIAIIAAIIALIAAIILAIAKRRNSDEDEDGKE